MLIASIAVAFLLILISGYWLLSGSNQSDGPIYANNEYGFRIKLTPSFKGYVMKKSTDATFPTVTYLNFTVKTADLAYVDKKGRATPLTIVVLPRPEWEQLQAQGDEKAIYIDENNQFIFAYFPWDSPPVDLKNSDFNIPGIVKTFVFTR